jgi:hypothetical protein
LEELKLERGDSLKNLRTKAILDLGNITVAGLYKYQVNKHNKFIQLKYYRI